MKITVLSSLLRSSFMLDMGFALDSSLMVQQLLDSDVRKFSARPDVFPIELITVNAYDDDEAAPMGGNQQHQDVGKIALVPLHGLMLKYGTMCSYGTTEIAQYLAHQMADESVIGIILDVDTPGGEVGSIPPLIEVLQARTKPVIALSDVNCSAGYFTSIYCDEIWSANDIGATFGSIGVQISFADMKPHWEKQGVKFHRITPPESADKNKVFELALEGKYEDIVSEMLSPMAQRFQKEVRAHRPTLKDEPGVLTGKTYLANQALELGLIDRVGNMRQAIARVGELAVKYEAQKFINAYQ